MCKTDLERYYGNLQGLNKAQTTEKFGEDMVHEWRRSFVKGPPGGESLEDTAKRTILFFQNRIFPHIKDGDNVLVSAHSNSLRSIIMYIDNLSIEEIPNLELATSVPIVYEINQQGKVTSSLII